MNSTDLKTGTIFKEKNTPFVVLKYKHTKVARGGATVKVKVKNLISGAVLEKNFKAAEKIDDADVVRKNAQYIYEDSGYMFMDPDSFEQFKIPEDVIAKSAKFLREGELVSVLYFEGTPISISLPKTMAFEVTYTEPGHKGNTVSTVFKDATLDNGAVVKVPSFIKIGDNVKINTELGEYSSKA